MEPGGSTWGGVKVHLPGGGSGGTDQGTPGLYAQPCQLCGFERTSFYFWALFSSSPSQGVEESSLQLRTPDQTLRGLLMKQTLLQTPVPQSWAEQQL